MGKGKRRQKGKPARTPPGFDLDEPIDHEKISGGQIPWSADELADAFVHFSSLYTTPQDDWDRRKQGIDLVQPDGSASRYLFNPDNKLNQVMTRLMDRFRKQGLTMEAAMAHGLRLMQVQAFLHEHVKRLRDEKLIIADPEDSRFSLTASSLFEALAVAPYEGVRLQGPNGDPERTFHVDRVIAEAKRLESTQDGEASGD